MFKVVLLGDRFRLYLGFAGQQRSLMAGFLAVRSAQVCRLSKSWIVLVTALLCKDKRAQMFRAVQQELFPLCLRHLAVSVHLVKDLEHQKKKGPQ